MNPRAIPHPSFGTKSRSRFENTLMTRLESVDDKFTVTWANLVSNTGPIYQESTVTREISQDSVTDKF